MQGNAATVQDDAATVQDDAATVQDSIATLLEAITDAVTAVDPQRSALVHGDRSSTWAEFDDRAARLAGHLVSAGVGPGERVGIALYNSPEYLETFYGALKLRAVPVNVNYRYREAELAQVLAYADVRALIADTSMREVATAVVAELPSVRALLLVGEEAAPVGAVAYEEALAAASPLPRQLRSGHDEILLLTGGTTGAPKGVVWDCAGVCRVVSSAFRRAEVPIPRDRDELVAAARDVVRSGTAPVMLPGSPLMHGTGFFATLGNLLRGGRIVTLPGRTLDPAALWGAVQRHRVEELAIVGDAFAVPLLAELDRAATDGRPYDLGSLRRVFSSGVRWSPDVKRRLLRAGRMTLQDSIAATEGGPFGISLVGPDPDSVTSRFTLPPTARVIGPDGRDVVPGSGDVGTLACTGPLPLRYLDAPDLTAAVFREIDGVRYAVPGDAATVEADGSLTLLGRGNGVINTGGEKVFAEEVEEVLVEHPGVAEAVVVGVPDERWGSRIAALVVAEPGLAAGSEPTEDELADHVGRRLAGYKRPRAVFFVEQVDRTISGKIDRTRASERVRQLASERDRAPAG